MSIIHEALKKTGSSSDADITREAQAPASRPMRPEVQVHRRRSSKGWGPLFILAACLLVAAPFLLPFLSPSPTVASREASNAQGQFAIEEAPLPAPSPAPASPWRGFNRPASFVLSGVVYSTKESYCLINGLVLRQGEKVGSATVEIISPDQVTLDVNGEKIVLPVTVS